MVWPEQVPERVDSSLVHHLDDFSIFDRNVVLFEFVPINSWLRICFFGISFWRHRFAQYRARWLSTSSILPPAASFRLFDYRALVPGNVLHGVIALEVEM